MAPAPAKLTIMPSEELRVWVEYRASLNQMTLEQVIQDLFEAARKADDAEFERLAGKTTPAWSGVDGLEYQKRIRGEW